MSSHGSTRWQYPRFLDWSMKSLLVFLLLLLLLFIIIIYYYYLYIYFFNSINPKNPRERAERESLSLFLFLSLFFFLFFLFFFFFFFFFSFFLFFSFLFSRAPSWPKQGTGRSPPLTDRSGHNRHGEGRRQRRATLSSSERQGRWSIVIAGAEKPKERRDQTGVPSPTKIDDTHRRQSCTEARKEGERRKEEEESLPRPPVIPPARNRGEHESRAAASIGGIREEKRGKRPVGDLLGRGRSLYREP